MSQDQAQSTSQHEAGAASFHTTEDTEMTELEDTKDTTPQEQKPAELQASNHVVSSTDDTVEGIPSVDLASAQPAVGFVSSTPDQLKRGDGIHEVHDSTKAYQGDGARDQKLAVQTSVAQATSVPTSIPEPAAETPKQTSAPGPDAIVPGISATNPVLAKVQSRPTSRAASVAPSGNADHNTGKNTGAPARIYLKEQVNDWLLDGMRWIAHTRPQNGLASLGQYLSSADQWRSEPGNQGKEASNFHKYWVSYQSWKEKNDGKTEADFKALSRP